MLKNTNNLFYISEKECEAEAKNEELCIFGVPLDVAVERQRCHDGIPLPMVVRLCVDYVEDQGLMLEGIYRSSGVKSKVNKLRAAFNSRTCSGIALSDYEPAVVASVLKQVSKIAYSAPNIVNPLKIFFFLQTFWSKKGMFMFGSLYSVPSHFRKFATYAS